jgi:hypothetical protein
MTLNTQQYQKKPETIEVIELTQDNIREVARWCGGTQNSVRNILNETNCSEAHSLAIPSIYGGISAEIGTFIARNAETGVFSVMTKEHLDAEYQRIGLRQDGIFGNRNGQR